MGDYRPHLTAAKRSSVIAVTEVVRQRADHEDCCNLISKRGDHETEQERHCEDVPQPQQTVKEEEDGGFGSRKSEKDSAEINEDEGARHQRACHGLRSRRDPGI